MGTTTEYYHRKKKQSEYQKARNRESETRNFTTNEVEQGLRSGKNIEGYVDRRGRRKR